MNPGNRFLYLDWGHLSIILTIIIAGYIVFNLHYWKEENKIIASDVIHYYSYLPATFIHSDISLKFTDKDPSFYQSRIRFEWAENGGRVIKTTAGLAILYSPFFIVAHQFALISSSYSPDGFSSPYSLAIIFASLFYFVIALTTLRKLLLRYFSSIVVFWSILIVGIGSNLLTYVTKEPGMSHAFSFFLFSMAIFFYDSWLSSKKSCSILKLGIIMGLIVLIRPTNALIVLFLFIYKINSWSDIKDRVNFFFINRRKLFVSILLSLLVVLPQLIYWKYITGEWVYYSYGEDEKFYFNDPKILEGLFSYRAGWLLYSPLMVFSIIGLFVPNNRLRGVQKASLLFLSIQLYIIFSWWCWWYGGSFGMRSMIDVYPILIIPIALFLSWVLRKKWFLKVPVLTIITGLLVINIYQSYQYREGLIHYESMTKEAYWKIFLKQKAPKNFHETLETPNYESAKKGDREI